MSKNKAVTAAQQNAIRRIITEQMGLKLGHAIDSSASLEHFLKIDGLDMDEITMSMEEEFEIEIPNHVISKWNVVADIEQYVANSVSSDFENAPRAAQPKKIAVKKSKAVAQPAKFMNGRSQNMMRVIDELEKKLKPTKATEGFSIKVEGSNTIACYGADPAQPFARAVVSVGEGFNGFRLYVGKMLVIEHNIGSESHILELCNMALIAGASMPASLDDWLVAVIVRYVACVKKTLRYMQHLDNRKDTTQQLFKIQSEFELEIASRVFDFYEFEYIVGHKQVDVLRTFEEMLSSAHGRKNGGCYIIGSSFRDIDGWVENEEQEEEEEFPGETIDGEDGDEIVDLLADVSTPGLVALFNHIASEGMGDFDDSEVHDLSGIKRRIAIIHEFCESLTVDAIVEYARATDLKSGDAAIFAGR